MVANAAITLVTLGTLSHLMRRKATYHLLMKGNMMKDHNANKGSMKKTFHMCLGKGIFEGEQKPSTCSSLPNGGCTNKAW